MTGMLLPILCRQLDCCAHTVSSLCLYLCILWVKDMHLLLKNIGMFFLTGAESSQVSLKAKRVEETCYPEKMLQAL